MSRILRYEIMKILKKKSTWAAFIILLGVEILFVSAPGMGTSYVDGEFLETHAERNRIDREYGISMSGREIDDKLLAEMREAYGKLGDTTDRRYLFSDLYQKEVRPYSMILDMLMSWGYYLDINPMEVTEAELYSARKKAVQKSYDAWGLTEKEKRYWDEKEAHLPEKFTYEYGAAYVNLNAMMTGAYGICLLLTFFIAICMGNVFNDEEIFRTDQLVLATRHGRQKLYFAKLLAGTIVVIAGTALFVVIAVAGSFICYGTEGFHVLFQVAVAPFYPYQMTVGEACLILAGILFLGVVLIGILTMVSAYILHNSIGAMAIMIGGAFAARLINIPVNFGIWSKLWMLMPINLLKVDWGFTDLRLLSVFGIQMTTWQFAPILYVLTGIAAVLIGKHFFCRGEVKGR